MCPNSQLHACIRVSPAAPSPKNKTLSRFSHSFARSCEQNTRGGIEAEMTTLTLFFVFIFLIAI
jgi:hypothetical protein